MPGLFERLQAKLELMRIEKRYTRNRNSRSTFVSNAVYVDGEYIYQTPLSTGSSSESGSASSQRRQQQQYHQINALHYSRPEPDGTVSSPSSPSLPSSSVDAPAAPAETAKKDKKSRFSAMMPGFGSDSRPAQDGSGWR